MATEAAGYAKICGILSLILAILAFIIPLFGVLFVAPLAIITGCIAMYGGSKGLGIATLIILIINFVVSPSFWLNIGAGASQPEALANRLLTYFDVFGCIVMIGLVIRKRN
jgi:hypothetical protein